MPLADVSPTLFVAVTFSAPGVPGAGRIGVRARGAGSGHGPVGSHRGGGRERVARDAGVGVGGAGGDVEGACSGCRPEPDGRAGAGVVGAAAEVREREGRCARRGGVDHDRRADRWGRRCRRCRCRSASAGSSCRWRRSARSCRCGRRRAIAAAAVARQCSGLHRQHGGREARCGSVLGLREVGAAVDRQRRAAVEVAGAAAADGRGAVGAEGAAGRSGHVSDEGDRLVRGVAAGIPDGRPSSRPVPPHSCCRRCTCSTCTGPWCRSRPSR